MGRKNWLFVGSEDGGEANARFVSLLASCQLHEIEPWSYLRDLFCLIPDWPKKNAFQLAPAYWKETATRPEVKTKLQQNPFRCINEAYVGAVLEAEIATKNETTGDVNDAVR